MRISDWSSDVCSSDLEGKVSLRASVTGEIVMDGVEVGEDALLPHVSGLKGPFGCLNRARYGLGWGALGPAEFCYEAARTCTGEHQQFGRPIAANQIVQDRKSVVVGKRV